MTDEHGAALDADVYHAGHHGSTTSSTPEFMDAVDPTIALISSDYDSQYDHPHQAVLDRFADRGMDAYWTASHGTIVMTSDGEAITVATQHAATTDPGELRSADEATAEPSADTEEHRTYDADALATLEPVATAPVAPHEPAVSQGLTGVGA